MFAWYPRINQSWDLSLQNSSNPCMTAPAYLFDCLFPGLVYHRQLDEGWKVVWRGWELKDTRRMERNGNFWENILYSVSWNWFLFYCRCRCKQFSMDFWIRSNFIFGFSQIITWLIYCKLCNIWNSLSKKFRCSQFFKVSLYFRLSFFSLFFFFLRNLIFNF